MLTAEQKEIVRGWAEQGAELAEIHRRLAEELNVRITYLDARLLVSELEVSLDKPEEPEEAEKSSSDDDTLDDSFDDDFDDDALPAGNVRVSVDQIAQPHAVVSGRVTFSDGKGGAWYLDQMGRLGIDPDEESYRPSQEDVISFQKQLQETLKQQGY